MLTGRLNTFYQYQYTICLVQHKWRYINKYVGTWYQNELTNHQSVFTMKIYKLCGQTHILLDTMKYMQIPYTHNFIVHCGTKISSIPLNHFQPHSWENPSPLGYKRRGCTAFLRADKGIFGHHFHNYTFGVTQLGIKPRIFLAWCGGCGIILILTSPQASMLIVAINKGSRATQVADERVIC